MANAAQSAKATDYLENLVLTLSEFRIVGFSSTVRPFQEIRWNGLISLKAIDDLLSLLPRSTQGKIPTTIIYHVITKLTQYETPD